MALTPAWKEAIERFSYLERYEDIRPTVAAMQRLVAVLCESPMFKGVRPIVSLGSLNLHMGDSPRYVNVVWTEDEPSGYKVAFVDIPLVFSQRRIVSEPEVVATILDYLGRLRE